MRAALLLVGLCAGANGAIGAEIYKWVGPDGKVTYSDTPPPASARRAEPKTSGGAAAAAPQLPYALARAAEAAPVTLYAGADCAPCDSGRTLLKQRGIPFTEKTVNSDDDITRFHQVNPGGDLPLLTVGRNQQRGFEASAWQTALTAAGYPEKSQLPASWRHAAEPLAPPKAAKAEAPRVEAPAEPAFKPAAPAAPSAGPARDAPPGFRF
ncbi:protein of unknown function [Noviherbaspirillum humi]|uniref:DUF4124 domain-containing protein n=1 Tax=Noviherbaspirillum humi TaxID=1688639 RepID=A0A239IXZ3_9BURK|nr:glutaredoxin family protein [Noviherbaspirillum humi]SNS98252.1 protein of unknown function [Noviherbaspirillum humi]